jgi:hypothetical protein
MNNQQLANLAYIQAAVARVKGMEAANQQRIVCGESVAYTEGHFQREAAHLEYLALQVLNLPE